MLIADWMTNAGMTGCTLERVIFITYDVVNKVFVAVDTIGIDNVDVEFLDGDDLIIGIKSKCEAMVEAIDGFCVVLIYDIVVWAVTIITCSDTRMG